MSRKGTTKQGTERLKRALADARAGLIALKRALVESGSDMSGIAVLARAIAHELGYKNYVRWLDLEIAGFGDGQLGEMLRVTPDSDLPRRIATYRRQTGKVTISTQNRVMEPLPYPFFFGQPLTELALNAAAATTSKAVVVTIPVSRLPQDEIREWLERFGVEEMPVEFAPSTYARIVIGFRSEIAKIVPELEAALRFQEELVDVSDEERPQVTVTNKTVNNFTGPMGNVNAGGTQHDVTVTQNIGATISEVEQLFRALLAESSDEERVLVQPIKRFLEEAIQKEKSEGERKDVALAVARDVQNRPAALRDSVVTFVTHTLPMRIAEHAVLAKFTPQLLLLGKELLQYLAGG